MIVIGGALAQRPGVAGHAWVFLNYLLGFRRLGHDVLFLDRTVGHDPTATRRQVRWLRGVLEPWDLGADCFSVDVGNGHRVGLPREEVVEQLADATVFLNVMGYIDDDEFLGAARRRVFLDLDPGFTQMWRELGLADVTAGHDVHITVGTNIGDPSCRVPTGGIAWRPTVPPVVLEHWRPVPVQRAAPFTSICSWRGPFGPVDFGGETYGLRVHEFRRFFALPALTRQHFELALDIDPSDASDRRQLVSHGWRLSDPRREVGTIDAYQRFIGASAGELMVAKNMYVKARSGWFSDRSACYLAAGRPVIAQETGFSERLPASKGLLTFDSLEEAVDQVQVVVEDPDGQSLAAREVAERYFDSDEVLAALLSSLGV